MNELSARNVGIVAIILAIAGAVVAADPAPAKSPQLGDPASVANSKIAMLEAQVAALQKKLGESVARCQELQDQNNALLKRLADAPAVTPPAAMPQSRFPVKRPLPKLSPPADNSPELIALPDVQWTAASATESQQLSAGLNGSGLKVVPFDDALSVTAVDPAHCDLGIHKSSKGLGTDSKVTAGKIWIENGSLFLKWNTGDQSAAVDALKFASLEVQDDAGRTTKVFHLTKGTSVTLPLDLVGPVKLTLPAAVAAKGTLVFKAPPGDWQSSTSTDGTIVLKQNDLSIQIKYNAATPAVVANCAGSNGADAQHRLTTVTAELKKHQDQLKQLKYQYTELTYTDKDGRTRISEQIKEEQTHITALQKQQTASEAEVSAAAGRIAAYGQLDGAIVRLELPNGVTAAQITLQATSR